MSKKYKIHAVNYSDELPEFKTHNGNEYELCLIYQEPVYSGSRSAKYAAGKKALIYPEVKQAAEKSLDGLHIKVNVSDTEDTSIVFREPTYDIYVYLKPKYKTFWNLQHSTVISFGMSNSGGGFFYAPYIPLQLSISKVSVEARSRPLSASWTLENDQDLTSNE